MIILTSAMIGPPRPLNGQAPQGADDALRSRSYLDPNEKLSEGCERRPSSKRPASPRLRRVRAVAGLHNRDERRAAYGGGRR